MARILDPEPGDEMYDPTSGSGGLLVKSFLRFREKYTEDTHLAPLRFYGQEINPATFAMARMNAFIYDMQAEIAIGDTMNRPAFTNPDGSLRRFDKVTANPMWNQKFALTTYEHDTYGRFGYGIPPASSADWGWVQHMFASLNDRGKMAMVIDTGAVSRGSGNQGSNRERDIRKAFVEHDFVEAVLLLPENLFYNTTAPGIIMVLNKVKRHPNEVLLINASSEFLKGRPKNYLGEENIKRIADAYLGWQEIEALSKLIKLDEAIRNDYNLSPSRYVASNNKEEVLPLDEAVVLLAEAEEERQAVDKELKDILGKLGLDKT
jgi:type I restriction enzyme M protein